MRPPTHALLKWLLICAGLLAHGVCAQSLSIAKQPDNTYSITATPPQNTPFTLQETEDPTHRLWIDVANELLEPYTATLPYARLGTRLFRLVPSPPEPAPPVRVLILGDSTASDWSGWGGGMRTYFKDNATLIYYAQAGTSTRAFLRNPEYQQMQIIRPDYVLIPFGWVDGSMDESLNCTAEEFGANLRTIVNTVRSWNGTPILLTVLALRLWDANGELIPSDHQYAPVTRSVAAEMNVHLIDMYKLTFDLFKSRGKARCEFMRYTKWPDDVIHFSPLGSVHAAQLIVKNFPLSGAPYLTRVFDPAPEPEPAPTP